MQGWSATVLPHSQLLTPSQVLHGPLRAAAACSADAQRSSTRLCGAVSCVCWAQTVSSCLNAARWPPLAAAAAGFRQCPAGPARPWRLPLTAGCRCLRADACCRLQQAGTQALHAVHSLRASAECRREAPPAAAAAGNCRRLGRPCRTLEHALMLMGRLQPARKAWMAAARACQLRRLCVCVDAGSCQPVCLRPARAQQGSAGCLGHAALPRLCACTTAELLGGRLRHCYA